MNQNTNTDNTAGAVAQERLVRLLGFFGIRRVSGKVEPPRPFPPPPPIQPHNRKEALRKMCEDDNARSRVEYLIASMIEAQADCGIRREFGTCAVFDNLIRIAGDVKLSLPNSVLSNSPATSELQQDESKQLPLPPKP